MNGPGNGPVRGPQHGPAESPGPVVVAVDGQRGTLLAGQLSRAGVAVLAVMPSAAPAEGEDMQVIAAAYTLVLAADRHTLTAGLVAACDRAGVRILPLCATGADRRHASAFGLAPLDDANTDGQVIAAVLGQSGLGQGAQGQGARSETAAPAAAPASEVIAVWGPQGAPGRSTLAVEVAAEFSRGRHRVGLVDADTHAPALALMLGLGDDGPGFATVCRQAGRAPLDAGELDRICAPVPVGDGQVDVLPGINRASRWPELSGPRVEAALGACRQWAQHTVVDVAASLERDEEIVSDLTDGPRRNAATLAALRAADKIIAVASGDPLGIARFLHAHAELRHTVGATPVCVVVNKLRPGALGIDARGQVARTLERFAGIRDVWFIPSDARATDSALLTARPVAEAAPRSPLTLAVRRFVGEAVAPAPAVPHPRAHGKRGARARAKAAADSHEQPGQAWV